MFKFKLLFITVLAVLEVCSTTIECEQKKLPLKTPECVQERIPLNLQRRDHCDRKNPPGPNSPPNGQPNAKPTPLLVGLTPSEWCQCRHLPVAQHIPVLGKVSQAELDAGLKLVRDDDPDLTTPKSAGVCRKIENFLSKTFKK